MTSRPVPKVFLSFAWRDHELAREVTQVLSRAGLEVLRVDEVAPDGVASDRMRETILRSDAAVVVLSDIASGREVPANVLFDIGAAMGAGKPIFVVVERMTGKLPFGAPDLHVLPFNRVEEIVQQLTSRAA